MVFASVNGWVFVQQTGTFLDAGTGNAGIYTSGQFICIGVTLVDWSGAAWNKARMAHISSSKASLIRNNDKGFYTGYTDVASDNLWLMIGSKTNVNVTEIAGFVQKNLPQLQDDHIWSYQVNTSNALGSAVSNTGFFGEP